MFILHPQLEKDCLVIGDLPLCRVLLMNDSNYPWCILVPRRDGIREIHELVEADQRQLLAESGQLARALTGLFRPHKLNIAALGNQVPQLHLHHIARFTDDPAWPRPVWGQQPARPYPAAEAAARRAALQTALGLPGMP